MIYTKLRNLSLFVDRAIILSVVEMVYCVVYFCSTLSTIEKNCHFYGFPKDNDGNKYGYIIVIEGIDRDKT